MKRTINEFAVGGLVIAAIVSVLLSAAEGYGWLNAHVAKTAIPSLEPAMWLVLFCLTAPAVCDIGRDVLRAIQKLTRKKKDGQ